MWRLRDKHILVKLPTLEEGMALCLMCGLPVLIEKEKTPCDARAVEQAGVRLATHWPTPELGVCRDCGTLTRLVDGQRCGRCQPLGQVTPT